MPAFGYKRTLRLLEKRSLELFTEQSYAFVSKTKETAPVLSISSR